VENQNEITDVIGFDTESFLDGKPFLYTDSFGTYYFPEDIPQKIFSQKYETSHFVCWNLKYDSGSILYNLPKEKLQELWLKTETEYDGYKYEYIPHKLLRISRGKKSIKFWDIAQFYGGSLNYNAKKYLRKSKIDIPTKKFSPEYVAENLDMIGRYCVQDSRLTRELAIYFLKHLNQFGVFPNNLYSTASISLNWFKNNGKIVDVWRFWRCYPELLEYACHSYYGGKFEVTARGSFYGYEYDIISAYAYEISNLVDISDAHIVKSSQYVKKAVYGFLKVYIENETLFYSPVTFKDTNVNIYPIGNFETYITKQEYDFIVGKGVKVKILSGYWIVPEKISYPYRDRIKKLYRLKESLKTKNPFLSQIAKLMMNSFYGKMCQLIPMYDGTLRAGSAWNPIYSAVITANVRIRMSEIQNRLGKHCVAVHTDSVITDTPLPDEYIGNDIGKFKLCLDGKTVVIMSGMYQIGNKVAYRGISSLENIDWFVILKQMGNRSTYDIPNMVVKSWIEAVRTDTIDKINLFVNDVKHININCDSKRIWTERATGKKLLSGLQYSDPKVILQDMIQKGGEKNGYKTNRILQV